jgi:hypothetical protein
MEEKIGSIEIIRENELDKIYFPKPKETKYLRIETMEKFLEKCPLDTPQSKINYLFKKSKDFELEMNHYYDLRDSLSWNFIKNFWSYLKGFFYKKNLIKKKIKRYKKNIY